MTTTLVEERVPYARRIYSNRNLRLDRIRFIGFDMDYTLALYREEMEHLQAEMVLPRLVERYGYPNAMLAARYDPGFAIRGLGVDLAEGNVFKMDAHRFIQRAWHGLRALEYDERRQRYLNRKTSPSDPSVVMVDTLFSLPEISLYCQLVDQLDQEPGSHDYGKLWRDLRESMDSLHRDGTLKTRLLRDVAAFVHKDPELAEMLHRFRSAGKRLFILTNSEPEYTNAVMSFLLDGEHVAYRGWRDFFDFVVTSCGKPDFFTGEAPFEETGDDGRPTAAPPQELRRGATYRFGNVKELARLTGMQGEEVLYVGDHIYGDILRSKSHTSWRAALVVQEMERELVGIKANGPALDELASLEQERYQVKLEMAARALDGNRDRDLMRYVRNIDEAIAELTSRSANAFNPHWGMIYREGTELSAFGAQVEAYACVYTSRASNFRLYSPLWYFRSPRDWMAHELLR